MRTVLFIDNSICSSIDQLKSIFMRKIVPNSPFSEELLTIYHDGILSQWLSEGRTEEERSIYEKIKALPSNLTNSEILEKLLNGINILSEQLFFFVKKMRARSFPSNSLFIM